MTATRTPVLEPTTDEATALSPPWHVLLHNDEITTQEFVVWLLITLFKHGYDEARRLMLEVHHSGTAAVATCPQERAELYVEQVVSLARPRGFPLHASAEPAP